MRLLEVDNGAAYVKKSPGHGGPFSFFPAMPEPEKACHIAFLRRDHPLVLPIAGLSFGGPLLITAVRLAMLTKPGRALSPVASAYVTPAFALCRRRRARLSGTITGT